MLRLDDPRWGELSQAYGSAEDIPKLLGALATTPDEESRAHLWFALWRMLHGEGRSFSASYAAVPHLVTLAGSDDVYEVARALHLVTEIEACRRAPGSSPMPDDLVADYAEAIERLPSLVTAMTSEPWTSEVAQILGAALLVGKRQPQLARAVLDLGRGEG